jgi:RNA polymerase sigma-70 factor, ECF subfamily
MNIDDHDIRILVEASAKGDAESFRKLYEYMIPRVYAYLRSRTTTEEHAVDLAQDVFIGLYTALPNFTYRSRAEFYAYVFLIVRRTLAHHYGDKHTQARKDRHDVDAETLPARSENVEVVQDVERALAALDDTAREIVTLHHWSLYTFGEIALMLHMTESAVRVRHHRAIKTLKIYFKNSRAQTL